MDYSEQLETQEWRDKRIHILKRDHFTCQLCGKVLSCGKLNVHHRYYLVSKMAWEYEDDALITLCEKCHHKTHLKNDAMPVYVLKNRLKHLVHLTECDRCNGAGYLPQFEKRDHGICYKCWGTGYVELGIGDTNLMVAKSKISRPSIPFLKQIKDVTIIQHKEIDRPEAVIRFKNGTKNKTLFDFNKKALNGDKIRLASIRWIEFECDIPLEDRMFLTGDVKPTEE